MAYVHCINEWCKYNEEHQCKKEYISMEFAIERGAYIMRCDCQDDIEEEEE